MSEKTPGAPHWWQTLPGILTGLAAIITAVTGLMVAFSRTGIPSEGVTPASVSSSGGAQPGSPVHSATPGPVASAGGAQPLVLPAVNVVKLSGGDAVITILSAQIEPIDVDRQSLTFGVRYLNASRYPANFWSSSYRLIVADVPRAPINSLNEVVDPESAKEGQVIFELPVGTEDVVLHIASGDDSGRIPFKLP